MMTARLATVLGCAAVSCLLLSCSSSSSDDNAQPVLAFDSSYLDRTVDPCSDFYRFACGNWIAQHPAQPGFQEARFFNSEQHTGVYFSKLIEAMSSSRDPSLATAQTYYRSCLSTHSNGSTSSNALSTELAQVAALNDASGLTSLLARLHDAGVAALFSVGPDIDPGNPSHYVLELSDAGWSLPGRKAYADAALASAYQAHISALAAASGPSLNLALNPKAVFDFEQAIALAGSDEQDPVARYNPADSTSLDALPGFAWATYFNLRGFGLVSQVNRVEPKFLPALSALLTATPLATLKQYLSWRVLEAHASRVNRALIQEEFQFHRGVVYGQKQQPADDYECLTEVRSVFGFVLARHFVESWVPSDVKPAAVAIVGALRTAMGENLKQVSWLDDATRAQAQSKLELLLAKVAYPDRWPDNQLVLASNSAFLDMWLSLLQKSRSDSASQLTQVVDRTEFWASPDISNAFYGPQRNDITIPVAILTLPFFGQNRPNSFNFGALGSVVGHELTHAFDSGGRHFDGTGALVDWWTAGAAAEFDARTQCLVDQYSGYEALPGLQLDGKATLNENIADLGGLHLAWSAFQAQAPHGTSAGGFTPEQQFFLANAQLWCSNASAEVSALAVANDPHAPPQFRVNGSVRNLPEFAQAFSCAEGAPLAPSDRCQVW